MVDIRDELMCKKCRDWPKIELRLAKRRAWGAAAQRLHKTGGLHDEDLLNVLMLLEDPRVLARLTDIPPLDISRDALLEAVGIK
jgi:hypothetical protein